MTDDTEKQALGHAPPPKRVLSSIPEPKHKSSWGAATFNLTNAIVGSGIIGIPFTIKESGIVMGLFLLFLVSYLAYRSLCMLVETARYHPQLKHANVQTYEDLMFLPFGRNGSLFILINKFIFSYGCMVAYLLILKDTVPVVLGLEEYRELVMVGTAVLVMLPLSLQRDMASLAFASFLSVMADILLIVFLCVYSPVATTVNEAGGFGEVFKFNSFNHHFFIGLGIISQAMTCHPQALMINESLEEKTASSWASVAKFSISVACLLCTIFGLVGFLGFLEETQGNVLKNFDDLDIPQWASKGSFALLAIHMVTVYPMQAFAARHVMAKIFFNGDFAGGSKLFFCIGRLQQVTITIFVATLIPALIFDDLGPVLSITGAVGGSCLAYIGPGLIFLGAHGEYFLQYTNEMTMGGTKARMSDPSVELPAEGDAKATMESESLVSATSTGSAPCWWCLVCMPLWRAIAASGGQGMQQRLQQLEAETPGVTTKPPTGEVILPSNGDFYLSMFMVVFGVVAVVAGVASNILLVNQSLLV